MYNLELQVNDPIINLTYQERKEFVGNNGVYEVISSEQFLDYL